MITKLFRGSARGANGRTPLQATKHLQQSICPFGLLGMASHRLLFTFLVLGSVWLLPLASPSSNDQNVTLSLYYETLCPYCADFIVNHLAKVFDQGLISILNLRMIPWGNAFVKADGSFACQHGPNECLLNAVEACSITIYPDAERHFRFIYCVERLSLENKMNEWVNCFETSGLGKVPIDCYRSGYGNVLERRYAAETSQLNPPHRFVPWVVVNNQPLQEDFENFVSYVCKAYKGTRVPEACKSLPSGNSSSQKEVTLNPVCDADEPSKLTSSTPAVKASGSILDLMDSMN